MIKRLTFALGLGLFAAMALASPPPPAADEKAAPAKVAPITGTIKSIDGIKVEITVEGEKPAWVKKGAGIKLPDFKGAVGKIVDVTATTVVFNTKKAPELKVGGKVVVEKGPPAPAGC
jgi:hypothetical protein